MKCEGYFLFEKIIWEMKAIRIKPMHSKFKSLRQFPFLKKIKNFHFEGYFHARKGQFYQTRPHSVRGTYSFTPKWISHLRWVSSCLVPTIVSSLSWTGGQTHSGSNSAWFYRVTLNFISPALKNSFYGVTSKTCVIMLLSNLFVFYQVSHVWTYCGELFVNKRDLRSEIHVQDVKFLNKNIES